MKKTTNKPPKTDDFMNGIAITVLILVISTGAIFWLSGLPGS